MYGTAVILGIGLMIAVMAIVRWIKRRRLNRIVGE